MYSVCDTRLFAVCVATFGYPRIEAYLQLPAAYRSLSRPSSAPDAKAFTLRSFSLELPIRPGSLQDHSCSLSELHEFLEQIGLHITAAKGVSFCALFPPYGEMCSIFTLN